MTRDIPPAPIFDYKCYSRRGGKRFIYPHDGELLGPAWLLAWELLYRAEAPVGLVELARVVSGMRGDVTAQTVARILREAIVAQVLHAEMVPAWTTGADRQVVSIKPIVISRARDTLPYAYRPLRDLLIHCKEGEGLSKEEIFEHLNEVNGISEMRFRSVWLDVLRRKMVDTFNDGKTYEWVGSI